MDNVTELYFLGPNGTYCETAAKKIFDCNNYNLVPISTIAKIVDMVNENKNAYAVLPVENSIEGIVRQTIDNIYQSDVKIIAQTEINIEHCLISKGKKEEIKYIVSHPQALAQCQKYINRNFDENINLIEASSTAYSVNYILDKDDTYAAIASRNSLQNCELKILDKNIGDNKDNKTRFVVISNINNKNNIFNKKNRTSIVFNTKNESGALLEILSIIKKYNLNLIYLESRPSKRIFGEYKHVISV